MTLPATDLYSDPRVLPHWEQKRSSRRFSLMQSISRNLFNSFGTCFLYEPPWPNASDFLIYNPDPLDSIMYNLSYTSGSPTIGSVTITSVGHGIGVSSFSYTSPLATNSLANGQVTL